MKGKTICGIQKENENKEELLAMGYKIRFMMPWHWRITKEESSIKVDVWPTSKKLWVVDGGQGSKIYSNLYESIVEIFEADIYK